jgi:hypothetical protein
MGAVLGQAGPAAAEGTHQDVTLPVTAEDHAALAKRYDEKAAAAAREAAEHEAMLEAAYKAELHSKAPIKRAYEKMRKHCQPIIRDAKRLAKDMEAFAAWHRMRAAELRGE